MLGGVSGPLRLFFFYQSLALKRRITTSGLNAFGSAMPNSIIIGVPLLIYTFGELPSGAFTMALLVENIVLFPLALVIMDSGFSHQGSSKVIQTLKETGKKILTNQFMIAIFAGLSVSFMQLPIPDVVDRIIAMLAQAAPAVALFFVGGTLVGTSVKGRISSIGLISVGKLLINPLLVTVIILLLPEMPKELKVSAILLSACPMLTIYPIVASKYNLAEEASSTLLVTTVISFFSISLILWIVT